MLSKKFQAEKFLRPNKTQNYLAPKTFFRSKALPFVPSFDLALELLRSQENLSWCLFLCQSPELKKFFHSG